MDKFDLEMVDNTGAYSIRWILEKNEQAWKDRINEWKELRETRIGGCNNGV